MKIAVFGATGQAGSRIVTEARRRDHLVTEWRASNLDATDAAAVVEALQGHDVGIGATRAPAGQESLAEQMTRSLLDAHAAAGVRFVMVGGAGSLHPPGDPDGLLAHDRRFVPAEYRDLALSGAEQLRLCRAHSGADWTHLAPSAHFAPDEPTGQVEIGRDEVLVGPDGRSYLSMGDLAVALLDEVERPRFRRQRFTVRSTGDDTGRFSTSGN